MVLSCSIWTISTTRQGWQWLIPLPGSDSFGIPPRQPECEISQPYIDMAYAIQFVTEEVMLKLIVTAHTITGADHLVLAGGVALNCVANGKIRKNNIFKDIWIQPAAGDAGGAIGAAFAVLAYCTGKRTCGDKDWSYVRHLSRPGFHW